MRCNEKGSSRHAEVHIGVDGPTDLLDEYGEFVAEDGAICCFVGVDVGTKLSIATHFIGKTTYLATDVFIDGILRATKFAACSGKHKMNKKDSINTFLFLQAESKELLRETSIEVTAIRSDVELGPFKEWATQSVGVIEVRFSALRQAGEIYKATDVTWFNEAASWVDVYGLKAMYPSVAPEYELTPRAEGSQDYNKTSTMTKVKKAQVDRPGDGSWAVFRFYYRSQQSIAAAKMAVSYSTADEVKGTSRPLSKLKFVDDSKIEELAPKDESAASKTPAMTKNQVRSKPKSQTSSGNDAPKVSAPPTASSSRSSVQPMETQPGSFDTDEILANLRKEADETKKVRLELQKVAIRAMRKETEQEPDPTAAGEASSNMSSTKPSLEEADESGKMTAESAKSTEVDMVKPDKSLFGPFPENKNQDENIVNKQQDKPVPNKAAQPKSTTKKPHGPANGQISDTKKRADSKSPTRSKDPEQARRPAPIETSEPGSTSTPSAPGGNLPNGPLTPSKRPATPPKTPAAKRSKPGPTTEEHESLDAELVAAREKLLAARHRREEVEKRKEEARRFAEKKKELDNLMEEIQKEEKMAMEAEMEEGEWDFEVVE
ncbi:hypothetical protein BU16DRAFT_578851 [Lophium mytilinum]|uniref:Uncharacterized protein n=1 Tax=Lophium mytilinum TaxID=390894 RepID=A0A6A6R697_9PEZI|nr:hypothetical protein BU16DRAFT_578851 [Lophium mytilinum]